ncbi:gamma-glutamylcyclotransferase family protein [Brevibacillus brevis]|uniref:gamma-glutamylcyclotransferase family protein n=1 Tax=Brevibacillus brevis TaxID=1393 RepID=UPI0007D8989A|nr:gamma-glutamylcyclotransferase [Brevibacillus brevis]
MKVNYVNDKLPVFVYGTLLAGFGNHRIYVKPYKHEATPATIQGEIYHLPAGYPGLLKGEQEVVGEIVMFAPDVYEQALAGLDELETYYGESDPRNEYERIIVPATMEGTDQVVSVYVYRYLDQDLVKQTGVHISHGNWRRYMQELTNS